MVMRVDDDEVERRGGRRQRGRDAGLEPRFVITAKPMRARRRSEPSSMHDLETILDLDALMAVTARLAQELERR